jgi:SAM-dependent methyltransferase
MTSRYVRIAYNPNGRRARTVTPEALAALLLPHCTAGAQVLVVKSGVVFAALATTEDAARAVAELDGVPQRDFKLLPLAVTAVSAAVAAEGELAAARAAPSSAATPTAVLEAVAAAYSAALLAQSTATHLPENVQRGALPPVAVPGLLLILDFLTPEEEARLLADIDAREWAKQLRRRVQHFGHGFDYRTREATAAGEGGAEGGDAGAGAGADADAEASPSPPTLPIPSEGPLEAVARRLAETYGFFGDAGHAGWNNVCLAEPIRGVGALDALAAQTGLPSTSSSSSSSSSFPAVDQITINEYTPGTGIAGHIDTHVAFQDGIVSLSLAGDVVMEFTHAAAEGGLPAAAASRRQVTIHLPRRSLLVLRGEARHAWEHYIPKRKTDKVDGLLVQRGRRVSATFRCVRPPSSPCRCAWPSVCFQQNGQTGEPTVIYSPRLRAEREVAAPAPAPASSSSTSSSSSSSALALAAGRGVVVETEAHAAAGGPPPPLAATPALEARYVHTVYDAIAPHFSETRHSRWPRVEAYLRALPVGTLAVDVGCGNGKYLNAAPGRVFAVGCDRSAALVDICAARGLDSCVGDALVVPFRPGAADVALSIAVLHHISTRPRRVGAIVELLRAVRPRGGQVLVYAWAQEQGQDSKRAFSGPDVLVPWNLQRKFAPARTEDLLAAGGAVDEAKNSAVFQRYCHVYVSGELEVLAGEAAASLGLRFEGGRADGANGGTATGEGRGSGASGPQTLMASGRPGEEGPIATPDLVPDAAFVPVRVGTDAGGKGGPGGGGGGGGEGGDEVSSSADPIGARVQERARRLAGSGVHDVSLPTGDEGLVRVLESWWERDNWCVLLERG